MARSAIGSWGPSAWTYLHTVSFSYAETPNDDDRQRMYEFMHSFAAVLPCKRCRLDWQEYIKTHLSSPFSDALASRDAFSRFVVDGHNYVNRKLKKNVVPYETVREWYTPAAGREAAFVTQPSKDRSFTFCVVCALTVSAIIWLLLKPPAKRRASRQPGSYPLG